MTDDEIMDLKQRIVGLGGHTPDDTDAILAVIESALDLRARLARTTFEKDQEVRKLRARIAELETERNTYADEHTMLRLDQLIRKAWDI
jgi:hypothetical protein